MNTLINHSFTSLSMEEAQKLNNAVTETNATECQHSKTFTAVDLWNLQRRTRTSAQRRRAF